MYRNDTGKSLRELVKEGATLYATPDEPSGDGSDDVLVWSVSTEEPDGLHVRIDLGSEGFVRSFILERLWESSLVRCPICGEVDRRENMLGVDAYPIAYSLHAECVPIYVNDPDALEYIDDHYRDVPGVWGWDAEDAFVGIKEVDAIQAYLGKHGLPYQGGTLRLST